MAHRGILDTFDGDDFAAAVLADDLLIVVTKELPRTVSRLTMNGPAHALKPRRLGRDDLEITSPMDEQPRNLIAIIPVFNDWKASAVLLSQLDAVAADSRWQWHVVLVDDGSTEPCPATSCFPTLKAINRASVLQLKRNLGHQRAIAIGLAYADAHLSHDAILVMDGDGEDSPADVLRLLDGLDQGKSTSIVFAERVKRSEGLGFTLFYHLYRLVHLLLTGVAVRVGNFSVIPRQLVGRLVTASDLWNHYAATVFNSRIPYTTVPTTRAALRRPVQDELRFAGRPRPLRHCRVSRPRGRASAAPGRRGSSPGSPGPGRHHRGAADNLIGDSRLDHLRGRPVPADPASDPLFHAGVRVRRARPTRKLRLPARARLWLFRLRAARHDHVLTYADGRSTMNRTDDPPDYSYVGTELEVFRHARNWKQYYKRKIAPYIQGSVLEVGAGIGATTRVLCASQAKRWVCLEPDPSLARRISEEHRREPYPVAPEVIVGTLETLDPSQMFDCLLYIDVLEHIEDDQAEFQRAAARLKPGGSLVILCPAHQYLYSEFDRSIGHYRRYDARMMRALKSDSVRLERIFYLDSTGMALSLLNRFIRRKGTPSARPILIWDRFFVPCSRLLDPLTGHRLGKTVVGVWKQPENNSRTSE